jgi:hypothetical protein
LEMGGANGGLNEKLVYDRSPLREVGGERDHKVWRDRHVPLRVNGPSAAKILFTARREFFNALLNTVGADISMIGLLGAHL